MKDVMPVELPFNPVELLLAGVWQGLGMAVGWAWDLPFGLKLLLILIVVARVFWPELLAVEAPAKRQRYRRRSRRKWVD